jgi:hypothetical protein
MMREPGIGRHLEQHGDDVAKAVFGGPCAQGGECDRFHAVDSDRVTGVRA